LGSEFKAMVSEDSERLKDFKISFMPLDHTPEEIKKARLLAVAKRQELERKYSGKRAVRAVRAAVAPTRAIVKRESGMRGVVWCKLWRDWLWRVRWHDSDGMRRTKFFRPKSNTVFGVEDARLSAVLHLRKLKEPKRRPAERCQRKPAAAALRGHLEAQEASTVGSVMQHRNMPGVIWCKPKHVWLWRIRWYDSEGVKRAKNFRPKANTIEEVEKTWMSAVKHLRKMKAWQPSP